MSKYISILNEIHLNFKQNQKTLAIADYWFIQHPVPLEEQQTGYRNQGFPLMLLYNTRIQKIAVLNVVFFSHHGCQ